MSELPPQPPLMRPRKFNTKIIMGIMATVVIVIVLVVALLMMSGNLGGGGAKKNIGTQTDANRVALAVKCSVTDVAEYYQTGLVVWDNERVNGYYSGYAIVNGSHKKNTYHSGWNQRTSYTYNNVKIQFYDYCSDLEDIWPHLTGDATISGSAYYREDDFPPYSGGWRLTGSLTLSGSYACSITFDIEICVYDWVGTITSDGTTWQVSNYY